MYLSNHMTSPWVGDVAIDTKQPCHQQFGSVTHVPEKTEPFIQDSAGKKMWKFHHNNLVYKPDMRG